jgi:arylsulfatase A-like enzyme
VVDGFEQDPLDGVSFAGTFDSADAPEVKKTQYFDIYGSRGIYHDGWMAGTFGPKVPWSAKIPNLADWNPLQDEWELFDTRSDYSLMNNLASKNPEKLEELKALYLEVAAENKALPIGAAAYVSLHPQEMKRSSNKEWTLFEGMTRIPESQAPNVRSGNLRAEIEAGWC